MKAEELLHTVRRIKEKSEENVKKHEPVIIHIIDSDGTEKYTITSQWTDRGVN